MVPRRVTRSAAVFLAPVGEFLGTCERTLTYGLARSGHDRWEP